MKFTTKVGLASLFALSTGVSAAHKVTGVVTDESGNPINQALIELHGSNLTLKTNQQGRFVFEEDLNHVDEIHVSADGYLHASIELISDQTEYVIKLSETVIEVVDVYATPLHASLLESATPITVLSDAELKNKHSANLGDTLKSELGVHSSYYGPVSASPIIRGLDGPRVMISQNGLDVGDVSRVGPDHVVSTETSTVKQIEVLRGPATLFYGSGAIGGVVNVVDNRVPSEANDDKDFQVSHNSVSEENEFAVNLNHTFDNVAVHFDAFWRDSEDLEIPANPELDAHDDHDEHGEDDHDEHHEGEEHEEEFNGKLANSASEADGFTLGASYLLDNGYVGISVGQMNRLYGIPGHSHGGHEEHEGETEEEHEEHADEGVQADMQQERVQLISELSLNNNFISGINTKLAITDYQHKEIEGDAVGTVFDSETLQIKTDLLLAEVAEWHGAVSLEYKTSDFAAEGEEAFTPNSETNTLSVGLLAEKHFGDVLVQLGARIESVEISADEFEVELEAHHDEHGEEHGEEHEGEHHDEEEHHEEGHIEFETQEFTPISLSAGLVWDFAKGYNLGVSYSRSERAPSASELFSYGPHIGAGSFEIGAMFELHQEGDESHFDIRHEDVELEVANNLELSLRKFEGDFGLIFNVFYNQVDNFYYQENTGLFFEDGHEHGEEEHAEEHHDEAHGEEHHEEDHGDEHHKEEEGLPVYLFNSADAELYGFEAQFIWQANDQLKLTAQADAIRGKLKNGGNLPRIPPARLGLTTDYVLDSTDLSLSVMHYLEQSDVAATETHTDAYTMVDFSANHYLSYGEMDLTAYFKINNLLDEEARVHSSFLKNQTLLPGRGFTVGVRGSF